MMTTVSDVRTTASVRQNSASLPEGGFVGLLQRRAICTIISQHERSGIQKTCRIEKKNKCKQWKKIGILLTYTMLS